jgi:hypothetical protein
MIVKRMLEPNPHKRLSINQLISLLRQTITSYHSLTPGLKPKKFIGKWFSNHTVTEEEAKSLGEVINLES